MARYFQSIAFDDPRKAQRLFDLLSGYGPAEFEALGPLLETGLSASADPDRALNNLARLAGQSDDPAALYQGLAGQPRLLEMLLTVFAGSQYLSDILLKNPGYSQELLDLRRLNQPGRHWRPYRKLHQAIREGNTLGEQIDIMRRFQQVELLRIGAADLIGLLDLNSVTARLADLADCHCRIALEIAAAGSEASLPPGFAILAFGKLGGRELNYSSDIDLVFLAREDHPGYLRMGQQIIDILSRSTIEGFLYRVDMRLRPWGKTGKLVSTVAEYQTYLQNHARIWEKQAMLKARWVAGDDDTAQQVLETAHRLMFQVPADELRAEIHKMKSQIESHLKRRGKQWGEVKSGAGSIRDVEFVTQYLQLLYGDQLPEIRCRNTLDALGRLSGGGLLSPEFYRTLVDGYRFLRTVEHHLQIMDDQQVHSLPDQLRLLEGLAIRLGFSGKALGEALLKRYQQHSAAIREIYDYYIGTERSPLVDVAANPANPTSAVSPEAVRHLKRMMPAYREIFSDAEVRRHVEMAESLTADQLVACEFSELEKEPEQIWRLTIVAFDYPGELSLICGLLLIYGFDIIEGQIFTYESLDAAAVPAVRRHSSRRRRPSTVPPTALRKIVDVFKVRAVRSPVKADTWQQYRDDLAEILSALRRKEQKEMYGAIATRVAEAIREFRLNSEVLLPVDIDIDNSVSEKYTVLRIDAPDTMGFLYQFSNALALSGVYIARVIISGEGQRLHDTLFVTDALGRKITDPEKQRQLRAATVLVKQFTHLLPRSPNPASAMLHFRALVSQLLSQPNWAAELATLERPEVLKALARLLGVSDFLWEDFLRMQHANLFPVLQDLHALGEAKTERQLMEELRSELQKGGDFAEKSALLNAYKDREMFRIDMRYIQGRIPKFWKFSSELTDLADVVVTTAYEICRQEMQPQYGSPVMENGRQCRLAICALGKLGGRGIGFGSDIELMFIYEDSGLTDGERRLTNKEYFENLIHLIVEMIKSRNEGIFEIDLRLRPYGKAGSVAILKSAFGDYFGPDGAAWPYERQALVKMRAIGGDPDFCQSVIALRDKCLYSDVPFDVPAMRAMRERQVRQLVAGGRFNAKYSPGALVELEYMVQALQIQHGADNPSLREAITGKAMAALNRAGLLPEADFLKIRAAHSFWRRLIEALRMVRGNAKDLNVPPEDSEAFAFLARRLDSGEDLSGAIALHTANVLEISKRLLIPGPG